MIFLLRHRTLFNYAQPVSFASNILHLEPRNLPWQNILSSKLTIEPKPTIHTSHVDYFGNKVSFCTVEDLHSAMDVLIESTIEILPRPSNPTGGTLWENVQATLRNDLSLEGLDAYQYCFGSPASPIIPEAKTYAMVSCKPKYSVHEVAQDLMHRINTEFTFDPTATTVSTPVQDVLKSKRGVCQDFAHLMISCLRSVGIAARYNSGLYTNHAAHLDKSDWKEPTHPTRGLEFTAPRTAG